VDEVKTAQRKNQMSDSSKDNGYEDTDAMLRRLEKQLDDIEPGKSYTT